jgi:hypothetical protein
VDSLDPVEYIKNIPCTPDGGWPLFSEKARDGVFVATADGITTDFCCDNKFLDFAIGG